MPQHSGPLTRGLAYLSASLLVTASAGFGAVYAWTSADTHGPFLGAISVVMALGLEVAKPLAIDGALVSARRLAPIRAAALALLGVVAIAYSVTAELSLMTMLRGDRAAERSHDADKASAARDRYATAKEELASLSAARPPEALSAEIARLKMTPPLAPCDDTTTPSFGPVSRKVCAEIAALDAERATAM